jgi:hypothetical protein
MVDLAAACHQIQEFAIGPICMAELAEFIEVGSVLLISLVLLGARWVLYEKAGVAGWASLIPIYSSIKRSEIAGRPPWWGLLFYVPFLNIVFTLIVDLSLAKRFEHGLLFGLGVFVLPLLTVPYMAFSEDAYVERPSEATLTDL